MSRSAYGALSALTARVPAGASLSNDAQPQTTPTVDLLDTDEVRGLLETGRENGSLSTEEITLALDELDLDAGQLDDFYHALEELHIEVVDAGTDGPGRRARPRRRHPRVHDRGAPALPEGHRQGRPAHRRPGGRAGEAHRARRPRRQAADGRGEPPPGRVDRQEVPQPGPAVPRPDPGGDDRPRARRREVRLPQGLQVLDLRHLVDPPGRRAGARRQGSDDQDARPRRREAEPDRTLRAEAARRARPRADTARDRRRRRAHRRRGAPDPPERPDARLAREARRRRGGVRVRPLPHRRLRAAPRRGRRHHAPHRDAARRSSARSLPASGSCSSFATGSTASGRERSTRSAALSTSRASASGRSRTRR